VLYRPPEIPGYAIVGSEPAGVGGMAVVWRAREQFLQREVAIKVVKRMSEEDDGSVSDGYQARFVLEARTLASFDDHRNIVRVHAANFCDGIGYMVMEYLPGGHLGKRPALGMSFREVFRVLDEVASALSHAHLRRVVHRDIKPNNIMFRADGTSVVTDFGIAKHIDSASAPLTAVGVQIGAGAWSSPEQISCALIDERSDQYNFGLLAYWLLSGRLPFDGASVFEMQRAHLFDPPLPLAERWKPLEPVIFRMLAKSPEDRYPDIAAASDELKKVLTADAALVAALDSGNTAELFAVSGSQTSSAPSASRSPAPPTGEGVVNASDAETIAPVGLSGMAGRVDSSAPAGATADAADLASSAGTSATPGGAKAPVDVRPDLSKPAADTVLAPSAAVGVKAPSTPVVRASSSRTPLKVLAGLGLAIALLGVVHWIGILQPEQGVQSDRELAPPAVGDVFSDTLSQGGLGPQVTVVSPRLALSTGEISRAAFSLFREADPTGQAGQGCTMFIEAHASWEWVGSSARDAFFEGKSEELPAVCVSWDEAVRYADWLSSQTGHRYRLLSREEWARFSDWAALAASPSPCSVGNFLDDTPSPAGLNLMEERIGCSDGHWHLAPSMSGAKNSFGLESMAGNAWEWVSDCADTVLAADGICRERFMLGGSWAEPFDSGDLAVWVQSSVSSFRSDNVGFRVARELN
jgi:serine/threonine protein kinase/formylglycine-generating enzyme required for sulfatase activity